MKNETSEEASKPVANNSSLITAENSSSIQSKLNNRRKKLALLNKKKYSNTALFENKKRELSLKEKEKESKKQKNSIYITDLTSSKFRDTNFETKSTLHTTKNNQTYNSIKSRTKHNFSRTANINTNKNRNSSLPYITNYNPKTDEKNFLTYFGNIFTKDYVKNIYKEKIEPKKESNENINLNKKKNKTFRDDKNEYIRKTNEIKRLKYEVELKKEAIEEYKENIKLHKNSIEYTISNLKSYKDNLENQFLIKYNIDLRKLEKELLLLKLNYDRENNEINNLNKEISSLQYLLIKKDNIIKDIEKWIKLQIYIKEGQKPKDLHEALKKYENTFIFNSLEDLNNTLTSKENKNLRLMEKYNKLQKEKQQYIEELQQAEKEVKKSDQAIYALLSQKENILNSLKNRHNILKSTVNNLTSRNTINARTKSYKRCKSTKIKLPTPINNEELKRNDLGILYKPVTIKNDINFFIDCIYVSIIKNNIKGLKLNSSVINQLNNLNLSNNKKSVIKMEIIEISLNYLISSIKDKIKSDKNNVIIMEKTAKIIDLYHKKINGNKNKEEVKINWNNLMKKIVEKNKKTYFLPRGKIEKYNIVSIQKNKNHIKIKNKQTEKKIDIWDFLYDQNDDKVNNEIKDE